MSGAKMTSEEIRESFNQLAPDYDRRLWFDTHVLGVARLRRELMSQASGRILDVACGTGSNFAHFPAGCEVVGMDLSEGMLKMAQATTDALGRRVDLRLMNVEKLSFPEHSFDSVVSAISTCTFPNPVQALKEMKRVCRPEGKILLLEHGRSAVGLLAAHQDKTAEAHYHAHAGCRWNQDPLKLAKAAGLQLNRVTRAKLGVFYLIQARP